MASSPESSTPALRAALVAKVGDPGYTPGIRDLGSLLDLLTDDDEELARATERAVLRIEARHSARLVSETISRATEAKRPARGRLARLLGRLAANAPEPSIVEARTWLVGALGDDDPKTRHTAARALGKLRPSEAAARGALEAALLAAWESGGDDDRRALAEPLGKIGGPTARAKLAEASTQRASRAALMIDRGAARARPGVIDPSQALEGPVAIRFHSRTGLEAILLGELGEAWRPRIAGPGLVDARLEGPLARAAAIRTALSLGFPLDPGVVKGDLAEAIVRAIMAPRSLAILRAFTRTDGGPIRFRLAWEKGGHRRALAWRCAELVAAATTELVNDPTESTWEIVVDDSEHRVSIELVPRGYVDERFLYRKASVPASSHPTIAAALVRLVAPRPDDVVWDPFVGAGAELVERARLGPYAGLFGTDIEPDALLAARANLDAAKIKDAKLELADALSYQPRGKVSLIVTNPPMGRRVQRGTHAELLEQFVEHAARILVPGGALVWAVPDPTKVNARAERAGLVLERAFTVDMGGFPAELSVHRKGPLRA